MLTDLSLDNLNLKPDSDYIVLINGLNEYIYTGNEFKKYFNDCGDSKVVKYPVLDLVINKKRGDENYQNSYAQYSIYSFSNPMIVNSISK